MSRHCECHIWLWVDNLNLSTNITDQSIIEEDLEPSEKGKQRGLAQFSYSEVEEMTNGFQKRIGEGGFAVVYYGILPYSSKEVAVKVFSKNEAPKQFSTEV